jgi:hypothetical protein
VRARVVLAALASLPLAACATTATITLDKAVREVAPSYRVRAPASGEGSLGRRLLGDAPETNACFDGDRATSAPSWSRLVLSYGDVLDGKLRADLGSAVKVSPSLSASSKRSASVTLTDLVEEKLSALYLDASGTCAGLFAEPGTRYVKVLTRAVKAGTIEMTADQDVTSALSIDIPGAAGASAGASSTSSRKLQGASLFIADFPECFSVAHEKKECAGSPVGPGHVCDLGSCSFHVAALDTGRALWKGKLSCEGGASIDLDGTLGAWGKAQKTAPGLVYNVRVLAGSGVGLVNVDVRRWITRSEAPEKCASGAGERAP